MKTKSIITAVIIVVILIIFLVPRLLQKSETTDSKIVKTQTVQGLTAYIVKPQSLSQELKAIGSVHANQEVEIHSEVSGRIISINFTEGGKVKKGDLLVKLNDADLQAQRKKLQSQLELTVRTEQRQKQLMAANGISQQEYDNTLNQLNGVKADIELINEQIRKTEVRSPFNGVIGLRSVDEGAYLTPLTKIATLQDIDPVKVDFSIPEKYIHQIKKGDEVSFTVQGVTDVFKATVAAIEPKIEESTRSVMIRALCTRTKDNIFPGAFADVSLKLQEHIAAIEIPAAAVIAEARGQKVFIVKNGKAQPKKIIIGIRNEATVEVTDGLNSGDTVILTGIMMLKPETAVKISQFK